MRQIKQMMCMEKWINLEVFNNRDIFNVKTVVYLKLIEYLNPNTFKITMDDAHIKRLCEACRLSKASYNKAIRQLVHQGIIEKEGNDIILLDLCAVQKGGCLPVIYKRCV